MDEADYLRRVCRACLETDCELHELKDGLAEKYQEVTSLRVWKIDGKPKHVCGFCRLMLIKAFQFRRKCVESDKILLCNSAAGLNYIRNLNKAKFMPILTKCKLFVNAMGGKNETDDDVDSDPNEDTDNLTADQNDVALQKELSEIQLQNVDGYVIDEPDKTFDNKYNNNDISEDETNKLNMPIYACRDANQLVMVIDPTKLVQKQSKNELEKNVIVSNNPPEMFAMHESFNQDTTQYTQVEYLEDTDEYFKEQNSETNISNTSNRKETTISKRNMKSQPRREVYTYVTLTTLQEMLREMESKTNTLDNVNRKLFYRHILNKYYMKAKRNEDADLWDVNDGVKEATQNCNELERQHEIANSSDNYSRKLFYSSLKLKYREADDITRNLSFMLFTSNSRRKVNLYEDTDVTSEAAREFERKYQMKIKCFTSKEDKIRFFQSRRLNPAYLFRKYKCDICYVSYQREDLYIKHMVLHDSSSGAHECEVCRRRYSTRHYLQKHIISSHKFLYTCSVPGCGKNISYIQLAKKHTEQHKGQRYPCPHCGKVFMNFKSRIKHNRIHHGTAACPLCFRRVSGNGLAMTLHRKKMHPEVFPCAVCDTEFASQFALERHLAVSRCGGAGAETSAVAGEWAGEGTSAMVWEWAGEGTTAGEGTSAGVWEGAGEPVAACGACGETYYNSDDLLRHIEGHIRFPKTARLAAAVPDAEEKGRERPITNFTHKKNYFMCEMCSKMFNDFWSLRDHRQTHGGERPHGCCLCSKRCRTYSQLQSGEIKERDTRPLLSLSNRALGSAPYDGAQRGAALLLRALRPDLQTAEMFDAAPSPEERRRERPFVRQTRLSTASRTT